MLEAVPDLRAELDQATAEELADLFETFELTSTYDKAANRLLISATVPAELVSQNENPRARKERRGIRI